MKDIRLYIYRRLIETGSAPTPADTAAALGRAEGEIERIYRSLAEGRQIVLGPDSRTVWMAMPFSNVETPFTVTAGGRAYYANCAWDAFGVAVVLGTDARVSSTCADCGDGIERTIAGGRLTDPRGVVHFALPPRRWWDDVGFT